MLSIYKASAGSGKTFALTREYIRMLLSDNIRTDQRLPHSRILAVTFTKKATAEMKERILKELYILANTPHQSAYINDYLADKHIALDQDQIQKRAQLLLIGILQNYNRFSVSTIDGFFQQIVRTFALELGLSTTYDIALDQKEIVNQAVDDIFLKIREKNTNNQDITTWLIEYAQNNIDLDKYWNPIDNIKAFSNELSKELLIQQLDNIQEVFSNKETMRSYHETLTHIHKTTIDNCKKYILPIQNILSTFNPENLNYNAVSIFGKTPEYILKNGLNSSLLKVLNGESVIYKKKGLSTSEQNALQTRYINELEQPLQQLQLWLNTQEVKDYLTATAILDNLYALGILQDVAAQISDTNKTTGRLPISEINQFIHQIIDGQEAPFIYERIGQYYHHYMIDEFQDTSSLQWKNFKPLIEETESNDMSNMIVGDVKQSIYRFRNSDWHLLSQVHKEFSRTEFAQGMGNNWRTAKVIVDNNETLMQRYCQYIIDDMRIQYPRFEQQLAEIAHIYTPEEMHQDAKKSYDGYFHMQFFKSSEYKKRLLETLLLQLQQFQEEGIDLSRVTLLTRKGNEARLLASHLIQNGYEVQSAEGLRIEAHITIQVLLKLLKLSIAPDQTSEIYINSTIRNIQQYEEQISLARKLPLYEHIQQLIDILHLHTWQGATPYLTAFQDKVFQFTQDKVADVQLFLEYWDNKGKLCNIPAPKTNTAINIMTIHSSKGLEFDIVMIPFFNWQLIESKNSDIIWCKPNTPPFDTLPLLPVTPGPALLRSHFADDYILELLAKVTDSLNTTYVAITRPKYRLYIYGPMFSMKSKKEVSKLTNIGQLISYLYKDSLDEQGIYNSLAIGQKQPSLLPTNEDGDTPSQASTYISVPINQRLTLKSRAEDDFTPDTPIATVDLGILMHMWLSLIKNWEDAQPTLLRLIKDGKITHQQSIVMQEQLLQLQALIKENNHDDWFSNQYDVYTEQDIITATGKTYRPDRIMIKNKHAIIIDYKFGQEQLPTYIEQVRNYILLLREMEYTCEGYIVYNQLKTIQTVQ